MVLSFHLSRLSLVPGGRSDVAGLGEGWSPSLARLLRRLHAELRVLQIRVRQCHHFKSLHGCELLRAHFALLARLFALALCQILNGA